MMIVRRTVSASRGWWSMVDGGRCRCWRRNLNGPATCDHDSFIHSLIHSFIQSFGGWHGCMLPPFLHHDTKRDDGNGMNPRAACVVGWSGSQSWSNGQEHKPRNEQTNERTNERSIHLSNQPRGRTNLCFYCGHFFLKEDPDDERSSTCSSSSSSVWG